MQDRDTPAAGFFIRLLAASIDLVLIAALSYGLGKVFVHTPDVSEAADDIFTIFLLLSAVYCSICWVKWGATVGKYLLGIRIVKMRDGSQINWMQAVARWMSYLFSLPTWGASFLMAAFHPYKRTLHDLMAGTCAIRTSRRPNK